MSPLLSNPAFWTGAMVGLAVAVVAVFVGATLATVRSVVTPPKPHRARTGPRTWADIPASNDYQEAA